MESPSRFNPDGNARLTSVVGLTLLVLTVVEFGTLLGGLQHFLSLHVFVGLVLLPPIALKLASTGWRFARYYSGNRAYREHCPPHLLMRLLAPVLILLTIVLFGSGVAMGVLHGSLLQTARQLHGPEKELSDADRNDGLSLSSLCCSAGRWRAATTPFRSAAEVTGGEKY